MKSEFAVWMTGLPASGKSTITRALVDRLAERGIDVAVLESDVLRKISGLGYGDTDRDTFYRLMVWIGGLLIGHGVPVIFDATANRRRYRDHAREELVRFIEVWVDTPLEECMDRDPKGIYRKAMEADSNAVPGLGASYEPPASPDIVIRGASPEAAARKILELLIERQYIRT